MGLIPENNQYPISTSNVEHYNGNTLYIDPSLPADPTLNDVLEELDAAINALVASPTVTLPTDSITLSNAIAGGSISLSGGDTATHCFIDVVAAIATTEALASSYLTKATYNANTIVKADSDDTPIALTVAASTVVGRLSAGSIVAMTMAQLTTELSLVQRDATNTVIKPYITTDHFAVGASSNADKTILTILDNATFANCPTVSWLHNIFTTDYGLVLEGYSSIQLVTKTIANLEDNRLIIASEGTCVSTKDQSIILSDQTGAASTLRYWNLLKDGADSRTLKLRYYNGTSETTMLSMTLAGLLTLRYGVGVNGILDEDDMASDSATSGSTQQSIKAYVDNSISALTFSTSISTLEDRDDHSIDGNTKHCLMAIEEVSYADIATTGTYTLPTSIPVASIMVDAWIDVITPFTDDSMNTSTIGVGFETVGAGTEDIKNADALAFWSAGVKHSTLDFSSTTPIKKVTNNTLKINTTMVGVASTLTTGKMKIFIEYLISE